MRKWLIASLVIIIAAIAALTLIRVATQGSSPPRSSASALPRTPDGRPNLNGVWQVLNTASWDIQDHHAQLDVPPGQGVVEGDEIPYKPEALTQKLENYKNRRTADPVKARGLLPGVPRMMYMPFPIQITQTPKYVSIVSEYLRALRIIYTDGTQHPAGHIDFWMGDSRGRWEGDTLVVDAIHFNNETWFDHAGNFHSEALHLVERLTLAGPDHINYEVTVEDPQVFTKPWKMSMPLYRRKEPNVRILEYDAGALLDEESDRQADVKKK
jgi:hypothetical protein